jgi:hypothetical protein
MYGERFKSIDTFGVLEQINRKYAQYHDTSGVTPNAGEAMDRYYESLFTLMSRHQLPNGADRWGPGIKEMDSVEEDYFNRDEEEISAEALTAEEEVALEKPFEPKRRRSEDDEGDDELLQIAQRSPLTNGTRRILRRLTFQAEDTNGSNPSRSPPISSPPPEKLLREKRPRDEDEQEDEMDRLTRSSKRVISPDVKRRPSRGSLNGGRKIAISLGKK